VTVVRNYHAPGISGTLDVSTGCVQLFIRCMSVRMFGLSAVMIQLPTLILFLQQCGAQHEYVSSPPCNANKCLNLYLDLHTRIHV